MEKQRDPVLNIPPVDPFNPQPTVVQLKFGEPKQFEGKFGPQFLYAVKHRDNDYALFASKALDAAIYETGANKDDYVAIIRTGEGKDTRWQARLVDIDGRPIEGAGRNIRQAQAAPRGEAPAPQATQAPRQQRSPEDALAAYLTDENLYFAALARARKTLAGFTPASPQQNVDLNAVAFVLYKMAKDNGVELGADGDPLTGLTDNNDVPF
jgi:hypothetical protein